MDEPVGVIGNWGRIEWSDNVFPQLGDKMYAAPQKKEWVGLTDDEIYESVENANSVLVLDIIRAIEAKLKEKNSG